MKRPTLLLLVALSLTTANGDEKVLDADDPLVVSIAVPVHNGNRSLNLSDHFHVLLRNKSAKPLRLWTDQFSWGYDNLSFEQIHDDGKTTKINKKPREWQKNYADWLELHPGESYVLDVKLYSSNDWDNVPSGSAKNGLPKLVKLQAVYEVRPDEASRKLGVWTGKIVSAPETYAIW